MKSTSQLTLTLLTAALSLVTASCGTPFQTLFDALGGTINASSPDATEANADAESDDTTADATASDEQVTEQPDDDQPAPANDDAEARRATLTVKLIADYGESAAAAAESEAAQTTPAAAQLTACAADLPEDGPPYAPGLDCDGDGGVVRYLTPSVFKVALKRCTLYDAEEVAYDLVSDTGTLAAAAVVDLTDPVTLAVGELPLAKYTRIEAEVYYYELTMPLNDPPAEEHIRVYLSDDDFAAEGDLGHHQGDITLVAEDGSELGFVMGGSAWTTDFMAAARGEYSNGAGGTDPETGHDRGLFGDTSLWDAESFMQGAEQDIFVFAGEFELELTADGATLSLVFNLADSWFYEDFNDNQTFDPCGSVGATGRMDACSEGAAWAPLLPFPPAVEVQKADTEVARRM
jgi:hypothetical protein